MQHDAQEVARVKEALTTLVERIDGMLNTPARELSSAVQEMLHQQTIELKADIKAANHREKIEDDRVPATPVERHYYAPALREASARFTLRTDVNPKSPKWAAGLRTVRFEIEYRLDQLVRIAS